MLFSGNIRDRNVVAWVLLVSTIALHVVDEALTGFLPFYNTMVTALRECVGFFPAPTFSFEIWLAGLVLGILLCFRLTIFVARGGRLFRWIAILLGVLMLFNALAHLSGSLFLGRALPGVWSSPLLLISSLFMIFQGFRGDWHLRKRSQEGGT